VIYKVEGDKVSFEQF